MPQRTTEQENACSLPRLLTTQKASQATRELANFLDSKPLLASDLPKLHLLLSRANDATRAAIEAIETS